MNGDASPQAQGPLQSAEQQQQQQRDAGYQPPPRRDAKLEAHRPTGNDAAGGSGADQDDPADKQAVDRKTHDSSEAWSEDGHATAGDQDHEQLQQHQQRRREADVISPDYDAGEDQVGSVDYGVYDAIGGEDSGDGYPAARDGWDEGEKRWRQDAAAEAGPAAESTADADTRSGDKPDRPDSALGSQRSKPALINYREWRQQHPDSQTRAVLARHGSSNGGGGDEDVGERRQGRARSRSRSRSRGRARRQERERPVERGPAAAAADRPPDNHSVREAEPQPQPVRRNPEPTRRLSPPRGGHPTSFRRLSPPRGPSPMRRLSPPRHPSPMRCKSPPRRASPMRRLSPMRRPSPMRRMSPPHPHEHPPHGYGPRRLSPPHGYGRYRSHSPRGPHDGPPGYRDYPPRHYDDRPGPCDAPYAPGRAPPHSSMHVDMRSQPTRGGYDDRRAGYSPRHGDPEFHPPARYDRGPPSPRRLPDREPLRPADMDRRPAHKRGRDDEGAGHMRSSPFSNSPRHGERHAHHHDHHHHQPRAAPQHHDASYSHNHRRAHASADGRTGAPLPLLSHLDRARLDPHVHRAGDRSRDSPIRSTARAMSNLRGADGRAGGAAVTLPATNGTCAPAAATSMAHAASAPIAAAAPRRGPSAAESEAAKSWYYTDPRGITQGPCSVAEFREWTESLSRDPKLAVEYKQFMAVDVWRDGSRTRTPLQILLSMLR